MKHDGWSVLDHRPKGWTTFYFTGWSAISPENDAADHYIQSLDCPCGPRWDTGTRMLLHYAFDGRDLIERLQVGKKIL